VAEEEARARGIAMAANAKDRAVIHFEIENAIWRRQMDSAVRRVFLMVTHKLIFSEHADGVDIDAEVNITFAGAPRKRRLHC
jgi:hypothetical protein